MRYFQIVDPTDEGAKFTVYSEDELRNVPYRTWLINSTWLPGTIDLSFDAFLHEWQQTNWASGVEIIGMDPSLLKSNPEIVKAFIAVVNQNSNPGDSITLRQYFAR